ncbi:MBOAT family protein [Clostridium sp. LY3-2]|uniref:MBOAT family O-acyltransferase n=1 Tax=Clostridium sp. LY3-2 TaxID=2942482 RepID=UPI00215309A8|nr:MBOAT family O-acyltransferase [Clostridium sp. LY3-2]MCR6513322.1 MBOAT family protein [Clostridium sp. LY3-2]
MVFSSLVFLFRFLPLAFIAYFITPNKYKNFVLLIFSLVFYSFGEGRYFFVMLSSVFIDYFMSRLIDKNRDNEKKKRLFLIMSLVFNLGLLFYFKYSNFFISNINNVFNLNITVLEKVLPLGISFYTFQTMSYTIDVYKGKVRLQKSFIDFATFVCMFPQLIAGPIVKYKDISKELGVRKISLSMLSLGVEYFILGLASKVILANNVGLLFNEVKEIGFNNASTILVWISIISFGLQIYFDFLGYSLMAIGLGKALGFNFPKNFDYPYISRSISEFWRRWHITLGSWFREYVYIPLGGNRTRVYLNLFIVWFLTGLWHGAEYNFILWGLYFFVFISIEKLFLLKFLNKKKVFSHIYTIIILIIGWAIFSMDNIEDLILLFKSMFSLRISFDFLYYLLNYGVILILCILFSTKVISRVYEKINSNTIKEILLLVLFIISVAYIVSSSYNPFLYFRF